MSTNGRKSLLERNPGLILQFEKFLQNGGYVRVVCDHLGVSEASFFLWQQKGHELAAVVEEHAASNPDDLEPRAILDERDRLYLEFYERVRAATATAEIVAVSGILEAGKTDWRARAWYLERKHSNRWAPTQRVQHEIGKDAQASEEEEFSAAVLQDPETARLAVELIQRVTTGGSGDTGGVRSSSE